MHCGLFTPSSNALHPDLFSCIERTCLRSFVLAIIDQRSCILKAFNPPAHHVPYILLKTKGLILILLCDFKTLHIPSETPHASHLDSYSLFKEPCIAFPANRTSFRQGGESYLLNSPCQELFQTLFFFAALPFPAVAARRRTILSNCRVSRVIFKLFVLVPLAARFPFRNRLSALPLPAVASRSAVIETSTRMVKDFV